MDSEEPLCYQLRDTKSSGGDITRMVWSPKMDLIVAALADNSVILNRLSWQRVWTLPGTGALGPVASLCWRPDGRVVAIGRKSGIVSLHEIEKGTELHKFTLMDREVTVIRWVQWSTPHESREFGLDYSQIIPPLLQTNKSAGKEDYPKDLLSASNREVFSLLIVGDESGCVHMWASGVLHIGSMQLSSKVSPILYVNITEDHESLVVVLGSTSKDGLVLDVAKVSIPILMDRLEELKHLSTAYGILSSNLQSLKLDLQHMSESWEGALELIEEKFRTYSSRLPSGVTVSEELLLLLACGRASELLQDFLLNDLTANGMKKLETSLQHSYHQIRQVASCNSTRIAMATGLMLSHLSGMSKWHERFGVLGLKESAVTAAFKELGRFSTKNFELLKVTEKSTKSVKAFTQWLHSAILKISDENSPVDTEQNISPDDMGLVMEFLQTRLSKDTKQQLNLEVVSQYFLDQDLTTVQKMDPKMWSEVLSDANIQQSDLLAFCEASPDKSLLQLLNKLQRSVEDIFTSVADTVSTTFDTKDIFSMEIPNTECSIDTLVEFIDGCPCKEQHLIIFPYKPSIMGLVVLEGGLNNPRPILFELNQFQRQFESCRFTAVKLYNGDYLSVAMETSKNHSHSCILAQLSLEVVRSLSCCAMEVGALKDWSSLAGDATSGLSQVFEISAFNPKLLAVSGDRKLACLLSKSSKVVKLFDVDVDNEEEEDEEDEDNDI